MALNAVETTLEEDEDSGDWVIWLHDDDQREQAQEMVAAFSEDPGNAKYVAAEKKVRAVLEKAAKMRQVDAKAGERLKKRWSGSWWHSFPATYIIVGICVAVVALTTDLTNQERGRMGLPGTCNRSDSVILDHLYIQPVVGRDIDGQRMLGPPPEFLEMYLTGELREADTWWLLPFLQLKQIFMSGQVYRLIGPCFLHFGVLHILFNMMWMWQLGRGIEYQRGTRRFVILCLILGVFSNLTQLYFSGPYFGGMSGVVFGLIGYAWMKGKTKPQDGIGLMPNTVVMCIFWLFICTSGVLGSIANAAHFSGFGMGMLIGGRTGIIRKLRSLIEKSE